MKKPLLLIFVYLFCAKMLFSQGINANLKELFLDAEYFFLYEEYEEALYSYNTLYKRGGADNANINYRIGQCYLNISGEKQRAIPFLRKAVQNMSAKYSEGSFKETKAPYEAKFYLGTAFRVTNQLDSAVMAYEEYKTLVDPKNVVAIKLADKEIDACKTAGEMMKKPVNVKMDILKRPVNTPYKDYFPVVSGDETQLVYNSSQKFYEAVYFSKKIKDKWSSPVNITPEVESDGNQFVSSLSYDGTQLFLRLEDNFQANIMVAKYENGRWAKSKPLNKNINTKYWEGNACISKDGSTLYFSSNKAGGAGAMDLYKSLRQPNGDWGLVINLGDTVNTEFNEDAPLITEDGKRLYFVSQGHNTMGGYDIYYSDIHEDGSLGIPVNLGYPINTTDDDLFFCPVKNGTDAYMALYSKGGYGNLDLFRCSFPKEGEEAEPQAGKEEPVIAENPVQGTKERILLPDVEKALTQPEPQPQPELQPEVPKKEQGKDVKKEVKQEQKIIISRAIFFDFNSSTLSGKAKKELDYLVILKKNYPELHIGLVGNADAKGPDEYNQKLSEQRAQVAKNYLIQKGLSADQITIKGLGEKSFVAINANTDGSDNPEGRVYNRRVEINLQGEGTFDVREIKVPENLKIK
jgi:outer membrane protein OmpA-like peptidoglycan-associated protein